MDFSVLPRGVEALEGTGEGQREAEVCVAEFRD